MENNQTETDYPTAHLLRFQRCANYPREELGVLALAQALAKAARESGISMADIVEECVRQSEYCPTDHDLLAVATEIKIRRNDAAVAARSQEAGWRKQYGDPKPFDSTASDNERTAEYWRKDREMLGLMARRFMGRDRKTISHQEWFPAQIQAQRQVGLPVTPQQESELRRLTT